MKLENLIGEALCNPTDYIAYHVSRKLKMLYPDKAIVEGSADYFDVEAYARAGQCSLIAESFLHNRITTEWNGVGKDLLREAENAWFNVLWQNHLLDVIFITWHDEGYKARQHWVMAESQEIAENFFRSVCEWCTEVRGEVLVFNGGYWQKSEELYQAIKAATFENLILPGELKREIQDDFARFFASRQVYEQYGIPWKRGVLFIGPPGNGKTHTIKALVNQSKKPCLYVKSFKSRCDTVHENIRAVFARARRNAPCILVLEDLDSLIDGKSRSFLLNELDGFAANTGVVVVASTNHPERLDPAILDRPSRFDRKYHFGLPAAAERQAYISGWNDSRQPELRLSASAIGEVVGRTEGFSFAYLKELLLSSTMQWMAQSLPGGMGQVVTEQVGVLREQMNRQSEEPARDSAAEENEEDD